MVCGGGWSCVGGRISCEKDCASVSRRFCFEQARILEKRFFLMLHCDQRLFSLVCLSCVFSLPFFYSLLKLVVGSHGYVLLDYASLSTDLQMLAQNIHFSQVIPVQIKNLVRNDDADDIPNSVLMNTRCHTIARNGVRG